ncbi:hypothetical protein L484_023981 [Morus notabilis]|uniref:Uncharacterized protein n=1 Tax=Morus notabilis TaxID=981085 RepID=W9RNX1_9ROSA|nr:hypothetical protein L484_023981 [Morus notabilis]
MTLGWGGGSSRRKRGMVGSVGGKRLTQTAGKVGKWRIRLCDLSSHNHQGTSSLEPGMRDEGKYGELTHAMVSIPRHVALANPHQARNPRRLQTPPIPLRRPKDEVQVKATILYGVD